jgi:esterase/lipase
LLWKNTLIYYSSSNATEAYLHRRNGRANIDRLTSFHVVDTKTFSIGQQIEDINSVIKILHTDYSEINLYGVSLGALAPTIAACRNEYETKLVLVNGLFYPNKYLNILLLMRIKFYLLLKPKLKKKLAYYDKHFHPDALKIPTYIIYGEHDPVVNPEQSKQIYTQLTCEKQLIKVTNGDHKLMKNEYIKDLQELYLWLS